MSYPTTPAFVVHTDGSDASVREHPALKFLFEHKEAFDQGDMKTKPYTDLHTEDFVLTKSDGTVLPPGEASWNGWLEGYAPFSEHFHDTKYCNIYERNGSWEMIGIANIYGNLHAPGTKTKTDSSGRSWDVVIPGAFMFTCVQDPESLKGYRVKSMTLFGDGSGVVGEMIKRGMIKPEDLLK